MRFILIAAIAFGALACDDACQKANKRKTAAYEACVAPTTDDTVAIDDVALLECTETQQALDECEATCAEGAGCGAFDGTSAEALDAYAVCLAACAV